MHGHSAFILVFVFLFSLWLLFKRSVPSPHSPPAPHALTTKRADFFRVELGHARSSG
ncbi:hypothetical protein BV25DRAFT_1832256 [Artomyces pyxidatus]|uniref:Uncharacterized protein n=1 Tax=Artomyces pyxidatus TaxID=48021 RepID=A0ACB8SL00_9AGAM|nr:hypothetical protein BV25DRAFT_1832256 [Artomyces pyxidatus]